MNAVEIRNRLERDGAIFQTTSDTEVFLHLMARNPRVDPVESLLAALAEVRGAYSILVITDTCVIAARDPNGFRPLWLGDLQGTAVLRVGNLRLRPARGAARPRARRRVKSSWRAMAARELPRCRRSAEPSACIFEHVYFARPDSTIFGDSVSRSRIAFGARLAREAPAPADVVVPIPDSGLFAALGYSRESGVPLEFGLIRNHYVGRTFIEPKNSIRHFGVKIKLNPVREIIAGRRIVLVDDSIVRGTTSPKIVKMVRDAGAAEVHVRISCPPTRFPCHYGIDMPTREELIAASHDIEEICASSAPTASATSRSRACCFCVSQSPSRLLHRLLDRRLSRRRRARGPAAGRVLPDPLAGIG